MNDMIETPASPYWMLHFIVKHGDWLAIVCGVLPLMAAIAAMVIFPVASWVIVVGAAGSAFLFLLMRAFVELVRVIVDMLLPK